MKKLLLTILLSVPSFFAMAESDPWAWKSQEFSFVDDIDPISGESVRRKKMGEKCTEEKQSVIGLIEIDTMRKEPFKNSKCKNVKHFRRLIPKPYAYEGILEECDVNEDGLKDYIIKFRATGASKKFCSFCQDSMDCNPFCIALVLNKGKYFETDFKNSVFLLPSEEEHGCQLDRPSLLLVIAGNSLLIGWGCMRFGGWSYEFTYKNGNYMLSNYDWIKGSVDNLTTTTYSSKRVNFEECTMEEEESIDQEDYFETTHYTIEVKKPILLSYIKPIYLF